MGKKRKDPFVMGVALAAAWVAEQNGANVAEDLLRSNGFSEQKLRENGASEEDLVRLKETFSIMKQRDARTEVEFYENALLDKPTKQGLYRNEDDHQEDPPKSNTQGLYGDDK